MPGGFPTSMRSTSKLCGLLVHSQIPSQNTNFVTADYWNFFPSSAVHNKGEHEGVFFVVVLLFYSIDVLLKYYLMFC